MPELHEPDGLCDRVAGLVQRKMKWSEPRSHPNCRRSDVQDSEINYTQLK
jgi:hypothetical protein